MSRLVVFLALYFCIYGSVHLYLLVKVRRALYLQGVSYILLFVTLLFFMLAPIQARVLEAQGYGVLALGMHWIGYLWMGYLFLLICLALPLDGYHLLITTGQRLFNADWPHLMLSRRQSLAVAAVVAAAVMMYGAFEARQVRPERVTLRSVKIPSAADRLRIVQISDLHLGPMLYPGRLDAILAAVKEAQPDILVSTGDLIDGPVSDAVPIVQALNTIAAPLGKFAVTGNHEFYTDTQRALALTQQAGFKLLRGQSVRVRPDLIIAGVDDLAGGPDAEPQEAQLLAELPTDQFVVLLKHRPLLNRAGLGRIDLQLSGHTHKGQIFPFGLFLMLRYPMRYGLYTPASGTDLYVSRGTGTWGPPIRVLAPPEVTIIELLPVEAPAFAPKRKNKG